jgi:protein-tyrosine phosphatase
MIDLHLHLLPGVDDGPADLAAALALARECCAGGTPIVAATPHFDDWTQATLPDAASAVDRVVRLQAELNRAGIPLQVLVGGEAFLAPDLPRRVRDGLVPTLAGTQWLLVETSVHQMPIYLEHVLFELQAMGVSPLLAHPERYRWLHKKPELLGTLVARGVCTQVTASSLTGTAAQPQRALAQKLVRRGLVQVIASDRHGPGAGVSLRDGYTAAAALVGEERARQLVEEHPHLIVDGRPIPVTREEDAPRKRWLKWW